MQELPESGTNNLWYLYNDANIVVVFVHGVLSDSRNCWLNQSVKPPVYWPELLARETRLPPFAIYLGGYYTAFDSGPYEVRNCAHELFTALNLPDELGHPPVMAKRNIVFVCHSTGGIVVRYMLTKERDQFVDKNIGVVLIASPSYGSRWADRLGLIAEFYKHSVGAQLQWGNWSLRDLDDNFKNLIHKKQLPNLQGVEAYENHFVFHRKFLPRRKVLVEKESAGRYFGEPVLLRNTDHFTSVKPDKFKHPGHELLLDFMLEYARTLNSQARVISAPGRAHSKNPSPAGLAWSSDNGATSGPPTNVLLDRHYGYLITKYVHDAHVGSKAELPQTYSEMFDVIAASILLFGRTYIEQHHVSSMQNELSRAENESFKSLFNSYSLSERVGSPLEELAIEDEIQRDRDDPTIARLLETSNGRRPVDQTNIAEAVTYLNRMLQRAKVSKAAIFVRPNRMSLFAHKLTGAAFRTSVNDEPQLRSISINVPVPRLTTFTDLAEFADKHANGNARQMVWSAVQARISASQHAQNQTPINPGILMNIHDADSRRVTLFSSNPTLATGMFSWTCAVLE